MGGRKLDPRLGVRAFFHRSDRGRESQAEHGMVSRCAVGGNVSRGCTVEVLQAVVERRFRLRSGRAKIFGFAFRPVTCSRDTKMTRGEGGVVCNSQPRCYIDFNNIFP
jgi:hypothetical protein